MGSDQGREVTFESEATFEEQAATPRSTSGAGQTVLQYVIESSYGNEARPVMGIRPQRCYVARWLSGRCRAATPSPPSNESTCVAL